MPAAYYEDLGEGRFAPTGAAVGPWDARFCHGSPPAALLVHAIERAFPRPDARLARVAFDFLGPVPVAPCAIRAEVVRPGERIELARAELAVGGRVFTGCNVENASFGATNCAERTAVFKAVSEGAREFTAIAIASYDAQPCVPCGICRQVLFEFAQPGFTFLLVAADGTFERRAMDEILPHPFRALEKK